MQKLFYLLFLTFYLVSVEAQYQVGHLSINFKDATRSGGVSISGASNYPSTGTGRTIGTEIYYPALTAGNNTTWVSDSFPLVVFGHGFSMDWSAYQSMYDSLVKRGYVVAAPRTETATIPFPVHVDFGKDLAYIADLLPQLSYNSATPFFQHITQKAAIGGHSMGGGCTFLSAQYSSKPICYFTLAPANTNNTPNSINMASTITKPFLVLSGTRDCIAPLASNQQPMYDSLKQSPCKTLVSILDARHCSFSDGNATCQFGEGTSGCSSSPLSTANQLAITRNILIPYLNYFLKEDCSAWTNFLNYVQTTSGLTTSQQCNMNVPSNASIQGNLNFCSGQSTVLKGNPTGFNYEWNNGSSNDSIVVSTTSTVELIVKNQYCKLPKVAVNTNLQFVPNTINNPIQANDSICAGSTQQATISTVSGATQYNWTLSTGYVLISGAGTNSISFEAGNSSAVITVTPANQCGSGNQVSKNIVVENLPILTDTIVGERTFCDQVLSAVFSLASSSYQYTWSAPQGSSITSGMGTNSVVISPLQTGNISVYAVNSCGNSDTLFSSIQLISTPIISLQNNQGILQTNCNQCTVQWSKDGTVLVNELSDTLNTQLYGTGNYNLTITNANGCFNDTSVFITVTGIQFEDKEELMIYPNPADEFVYLFSTRTIQPNNVKIYDVFGELVLQKALENEMGNQILISGLAKGIYYIQVGNKQYKLLKN